MESNNTDNIVLLKRWLGLILVAFSIIFYSGLLLLPFVPYSAQSKLISSVMLVTCGEISFWIGALILGKQFLSKHRNVNFRSRLKILFSTSAIEKVRAKGWWQFWK